MLTNSEFFAAITSDDLAAIERHLADENSNPNAGYLEKKFFLYAVESGNVDIVRIFLRHRSLRIGMVNDLNQSALHLSALCGNVDMVQLLLDQGMELNQQSRSSLNTALHYAVSHKKFAMVKFLLEKGAAINLQNSHGETALHCAIRSGDIDIIEYLVEQGADLKIKDIRDRDAQALIDIYFAGQPVKPNIAAILARKADESKVQVAGTKENKPENLQTGRKNDEIISAIRDNDLARLASYLISKESANSQITHEGTRYNLLSFAIMLGSSAETVEFILSKGADINAVNQNGLAPIHFAAMYSQHNQRMVLQLLMHEDIDIHATGQQGNTALHYASLRNNDSVTAVLLQKGSNPNQTNHSKDTALHLAARSGSYQSAKLLIKKGAKSDIKNAQGKTPLDLADEYKEQEISKGKFGPAKEFLFKKLVVAAQQPASRTQKKSLQPVIASNTTERTSTPSY